MSDRAAKKRLEEEANTGLAQPVSRLRQLFQDHSDLRAGHETRAVEVRNADDKRRGAVGVSRLAYKAKGARDPAPWRRGTQLARGGPLPRPA